MRNPARTEAEAFRFVLLVCVLLGAIGLAAVLGDASAALGVAVGLVLGIGAGLYLASEPRVKEPAVWERGGPDEPPLEHTSILRSVRLAPDRRSIEFSGERQDAAWAAIRHELVTRRDGRVLREGYSLVFLRDDGSELGWFPYGSVPDAVEAARAKIGVRYEEWSPGAPR